MAPLWSTSDLAERFAPYVEELQEFFASCGLHYGSPPDVLPLAQRLENRGTFAEDLASMVRSIILREGGSVPRTELLEILAVSIGGPDIDKAAPELQQTVLHLLAFVNTVLRKPWNEPPGQLNADYALEEPGGGPEEPPPPPIKKPIEFPGPRAVPAYARPDSIYSKYDRSPRPFDPAPALAARSDFAPTLVTMAQPIGTPDPPPTPLPYSDPDREPNDTPILAPDPTPDPTLEPAPAKPQDFAAHELPQRANLAPPSTIDSDPPSPSASPPLRNAMIAGAGALLAAAMMIIFLRPTTPAPTPNPTASPIAASRTTPVLTTSPTVTAATVPVPETKPSPYGPAFATPSRSPRSTRSDDYVAAPYHTPIPGQSEQSTANPRQSASTTQSTAGVVPAAAPIVRSHPADPDAIYVGEYASKRATPATYREASGTLTHRPVTPESRFAASRERMPSVSSGMMASNLISSPLPTYPTLAKLTHTEGQVILQAVISRDGTVSATHVLSGHHLLRGAAVDAVRRWRYRPYLMDGHAVDVATVVTVDFHPPR